MDHNNKKIAATTQQQSHSAANTPHYASQQRQVTSQSHHPGPTSAQHPQMGLMPTAMHGTNLQQQSQTMMQQASIQNHQRSQAQFQMQQAAAYMPVHSTTPAAFPQGTAMQRQMAGPPSWSVPNPLGVPKPAAPQYNNASVGAQRALAPAVAPRAPAPAMAPRAHAPAPRPHSTPGITVIPGKKPKVVLSADAKQALANAIWSAIRSTTGDVDPNLLRAAVAKGLPENAVLNAARVARQRDAAKRSQQQLLEQQQKLERQKLELQKKRADEQKRKEEAQRAKLAAITLERSQWQRIQHGVFLNTKGRVTAAPFSVGAMVRTTQTDACIKGAQLSTSASGLKLPPMEPQHVTLLDPEKFKRFKGEPKKLARGLDRNARKARQQVAEAYNKQYKEFNKAMSAHSSEFFRFHRQRKLDMQRLSKSIRDSVDKEARKKEREETAAEKARLAALKANDMNAYSKLLEETRNDRLKYLLEKTERHFAEISTLLQERSVESTESVAPKAATSYYATAHSRTEDVRQPSILVGGELKEYQLAGLQWLVSLYNNRLNGILADEMGLGKTIQAISLLAYLMEFKQNMGPFLVIVPLSTLSNWSNEFQKWCPAARTVCYKGTPAQRKALYKDQVQAGHFNVLLTTYEYIIRDKKFLRKHVWEYAIVDEGHRMKNSASKFAVTLATQYSTKYRVLLTGTPLMNDLSELWSLLNFLLPTVFNSVTTFDEWFSAPFSQFSGTANEDEEQNLLSNEERVLIIHRLHELLRPFMLRRVKSEVLDQLPEKVEKVLRCDLSSWQKELYKQISKKAVADTGLLNTAATPTRGLNNIVMQLRKVCNHPYLFSNSGYQINDEIIQSSGKLTLLDQMLPKLKAAGHRVLMFTQMTAVMSILEEYFSYRGFVSLRLDGSTPSEEREKRMYRFNAPDSPVFIFLLSTRAGGLGLSKLKVQQLPMDAHTIPCSDLTSADTVIIFDSDWNPAMDLQAQDRAHRIGQRSDVGVFRLITNSPVEEKILSRATEKMNVSQLVVESGKFNKESVDSDNSQERKRLMEVLLTDFSSAQNGSKSAADKGSDQGDEDDDEDGESVGDKEDFNELLSNNELDFALYSDYDKRLESKGGSFLNLFADESDIPHWILFPEQSGTRSIFTATTDDSRKRKEVVYDDGLTEKQFLRLMDKQVTKEENAKKKQKTQRGPAARIPQAAAAAPSNEEEDEQSGTALTDWTYRKLISCSKTVVALKDPATKRRLSEIFLDKPDPATFPDYYELIHRPIAINDILRKCRAKMYANVPEFKEDWVLMFANARKFNGDDSWVVTDALALEKELERVLKKNGFTDDQKPPTCKEKKPRIRISLKKG